ncbi:MAG: hypothetical protein GY774_23320 [Planctomycetes bacterium]|nr:hypothetical protein [Planctomycetota bacterium]
MARVSPNDASLRWEGDNAVDFANYLEHQDFTHKAGVLTITHRGEVYRVPLNSSVGKNPDGSLTVMSN